MFKLYQLTLKAVKVSKLVNLITDTLGYFHKEGVQRGVFGNVDEPIKIQVKENDEAAD